jgi:hypothetical protein
MKWITFVIDEYDVPCEVVSSSSFEIMDDIIRQMEEIFPNKNVREVKFLKEKENSFEEMFVF